MVHVLAIKLTSFLVLLVKSGTLSNHKSVRFVYTRYRLYLDSLYCYTVVNSYCNLTLDE